MFGFSTQFHKVRYLRLDGTMEKRKRSTALGAFTRNEKTLNTMLDNGSPIHIVTPQFDKLQACWNKLEEAHDNYIESIDINGEVDEAILNSLDEPDTRYQNVVKRYSEFYSISTNADSESVRKREQENREAEEKLRRDSDEAKRAADAKLKFDRETA